MFTTCDYDRKVYLSHLMVALSDYNPRLLFISMENYEIGQQKVKLICSRWSFLFIILNENLKMQFECILPELILNQITFPVLILLHFFTHIEREKNQF